MLHRLGFLVGVFVFAVIIISCEKKDVAESCLLASEAVTIPVSTTASIDATWNAVRDSRIVVIFVPTIGYTHETWTNAIDRVNQQRWATLAINPRTPPKATTAARAPWRVSRADSTRALTTFTEDIRAAIAWVEKTVDPNSKIVLVGSDLGGVAALRAAAGVRSIRGVALFSPPTGCDLLSQDVIGAYGDRPLLVLTEHPVEPALSTARTLDTWLGRGTCMSLQLSEQTPPTRIDDRTSAQHMLLSWIFKTTL